MNQNLREDAMMGEAIASAEISMNTPDTEWSSVDRYSVETGLLKRFFKLYEEGRKTGDPQNFIDYFKAEHYLLTEVGKALTSRDTYWKERVEEMKRKLEIEYVEGECVECAGTGEGADNPNSDSGETYPCYLCKGKGRFSGYTKKTVDTLLDNLK